MEKYIMAIDSGTTSNRCIIFDKKGNIKSLAQKEIPQYFPKEAYVEQDADEIWSNQLGVCVEALNRASLCAEEIAGIGVTNQRETTIVWDKKTGNPVHNAIVWQCRRTSEYCDYLKKEGLDDFFRNKTGLRIDPYFSATKLKWILENVPKAREKAERGDLLFGTVDTYIIWKLSGGRLHITDYSNASRTMLFNIFDLKWDEDILEFFDIPKSMLPKVVNSSELYGYTDKRFFGNQIAISGIAGDQQAALFGQECFNHSELKNTYGTGSFLIMNTKEDAIKSKNGLVTTIAWGIDGKVDYALEGSIFVAGSIIQWLRDELRILDSSDDSEYMANKVNDTSGCYIVPAFTGLGAPHWDQYARGTILGLTRATNKYHIIRAALESIAYQSNDVLRAMEQDVGKKIPALKVDGGASNNDFLMQFQADISELEIIRPKVSESTALGVAFLAGLGVGFWKDLDELVKIKEVDMTFKSDMHEEKRNKLLNGWNKAISYSKDWAK